MVYPPLRLGMDGIKRMSSHMSMMDGAEILGHFKEAIAKQVLEEEVPNG